MELTKESIRKYDPHIPHIVYASDDKFAEIMSEDYQSFVVMATDLLSESDDYE